MEEPIRSASHELTRRAIYDLVWSSPMTKVAEDLGISDVGLKKICLKHRIPTPPRGYWAKKQAGKPVRQVRFHEAVDPQEEMVIIHGWRSTLPPEVRQVMEQERERRKAKSSVPVVLAVPEPVVNAHPAVAATAHALRKARPDGDGIVRATRSGHCGIEVGSASLERVITVLDALARALELQGQKLEPAGGHMLITSPPDTVTFTLKERIERRKHEPTMEELAKEERLRKKRERDSRFEVWSFDRERAYPEFDFVRTGELNLEITEHYVGGLRRNWKDGRRQRLETLVDGIAGGLVAYLVGVKARREEHERREREWKRQQTLRALAHARKEREARRSEFLQRLIKILNEIEELRSFLKRLREQISTSPSGELLRMMEWSEAKLKQLEDKIATDRLAASLREENLFPEVDEYAAQEQALRNSLDC